jgi:E3 Ubiquitin ligase
MSGVAQDLYNMAPLHFSILVLVSGAFAAYFFYLIWRNFRRARVIEDTPTARVRSAPQGYVELQGQASSLPEQPVIAPLTRTACVWFRFRIEREQHNSRSGSRWAEVESGASETPFLLSDDTGGCLVDPRRAEVSPALKKVWYGRSKWPGVAGRGGLLGLLTGGRYRYTEERIDGGDLYVLGWFDSVRSTDSPAGEELSALLREWKRDQPALLRRFDSDADGRIDEREWQTARQTAHRQVLADRAARSAEPATNLVSAGRYSHLPFLISARPEFLLSSRYRRNALLALFGSLLAASLFAWMLAVRLQ